MILPITKSARRFGYVIWNRKNEPEIKKLLGERNSIAVIFNGFQIGEKKIDWKYHRISLGYKFTRALPVEANMFTVSLKEDCLEVLAKI